MQKRGRRVLTVFSATVALGAAVALWPIAHLSPFGGPECSVPSLASAKQAAASAARTSTTRVAPTRPNAITVSRTATSTTPVGPKDLLPLSFDADQLSNASLINAIGLKRNLPLQARVIALATAFQESHLRDGKQGQANALGLFQQRLDDGWGTADEITDPIHATNAFYDALLQVPDWRLISLTEAAQSAMHLVYPRNYDQWESTMTAVATQLSGTVPLGLHCRPDATSPRPAAAGASDVELPPQTTDVLRGVLTAMAGELATITIDTVSSSGRVASLEVAVPGLTPSEAARAVAAWLVAGSTWNDVTTVTLGDQTFDDRHWVTKESPIIPGMLTFEVGA